MLPPYGESRGGCRWDTCKGQGLSQCRRRVGGEGGGGMTARASPQSKKRKKRVVALGTVWRWGGLWPRATLVASPEEDRDVGGLSYTCSMQVSPTTTRRLLPGRGNSSPDACRVVSIAIVKTREEYSDNIPI